MMMVNQMNNNQHPWPRTVPDQMPWFNPPEAPMQFVGLSPAHIDQPSNEVTNVPQPHVDIPPSAPISVTTQVPAAEPNLMFNTTNNPFDPNQISCTPYIPVNPIVGQTPIDPLQVELGFQHPTLLGQIQPNFPNASLTHLPAPIPSQAAQLASTTFEPVYQASNHKRSSMEMEDDLTSREAPPTKQQLSENKLFQRFGSLHLGSNEQPLGHSTIDIEECDLDDDASTSTTMSSSDDGKQLNRYVYLLFKDKKSAGQFPLMADCVEERLIREEREKLSKAVILWNPPPKNTFANYTEDNNSSDDDDDNNGKPTYHDHRDFLKQDPASSVVIEEVVDEDVPIEELDLSESDDIMLE